MLFRSYTPASTDVGSTLRVIVTGTNGGGHAAVTSAQTAVVLDRKSTRLNSSHTEIYTLSLHDALPILYAGFDGCREHAACDRDGHKRRRPCRGYECPDRRGVRSEEHTSELQSHRDLHSFPTRCSSDLIRRLRRMSGARCV